MGVVLDAGNWSGLYLRGKQGKRVEGLKMFDVDCLERAPFGSLGEHVIAPVKGFGTNGEVWTSGFDVLQNVYEVFFKDSDGAWYSTEIERHWPFFDELFNVKREEWQARLKYEADKHRMLRMYR